MAEIPYGYCGMPCALCSRHRTNGASRCEGCSAGGYYTDTCRVYRCCREKTLPHCGACAAYPCERLGKMGDFRDLNTGGIKRKTCEAVRAGGLEAWRARYARRAELLTEALARYNDGRMKRWLCELFIRSELAALEEIMRRADTEAQAGDAKARGAAFRRIAAETEAEPPQA